MTGTLGAKNVILLGDFNAGGTYIRSQDWETNRLRGDEFNWLIPDHMDTTTTNTLAAYDRLRLLLSRFYHISSFDCRSGNIILPLFKHVSLDTVRYSCLGL